MHICNNRRSQRQQYPHQDLTTLKNLWFKHSKCLHSWKGNNRTENSSSNQDTCATQCVNALSHMHTDRKDSKSIKINEDLKQNALHRDGCLFLPARGVPEAPATNIPPANQARAQQHFAASERHVGHWAWIYVTIRTFHMYHFPVCLLVEHQQRDTKAHFPAVSTW